MVTSSNKADTTGPLSRIIAQAKLTGQRELDLSSKGLIALPAEIGQLAKLQRLDLDGNHLTALPAEIGQLASLERLDLGANQLTALPAEIDQLASLQLLNLNGNRVTALPAEIVQLASLETLSLIGNQLTALPAEIGQLASLQRLYLDGNQLTALPAEIGLLASLQRLDLDQNKLTALPAEIGQLASLETLYLQINQLTALPAEIGQLASLENLYLQNNQLTALPAEIGQLASLENLYLQNNQLTALPSEIGQLASLQYLGLDGNQLTALPAEIGQLSDRVQIRLDDNPIAEPLVDLLERGTPVLFSYLRSLAEGVQQYEAKVLLVGEGNVGKSSLVDSFLDKPFIEERPTTHGIELGRLRVKHPDNANQITLNTWDFGGQEVYRITHQFFFSRRALYLLVWRPREGQEENAVEPWLRRIRLRVGRDVRVMIVATHCDERRAELDYPDLQRKFGDLLVGHFEVDNEPPRHGVAKLLEGIAQRAAELPQMGEPMNPRWIAARDEIVALPEPQITYERFRQICEKHTLDPIATATLADLLHDLGHIVYFPDDEGLRDIVVLKPEWLTKAIGYILEDEPTREAGGELDHARLREIWGRHDGKEPYPTQYHPYFLRLMEKFDISYRFGDGGGSLVAQLAPYERPDFPWDIDPSSQEKRELSVICSVAEEAPGLVTWLTVRNHRFSTGRHWRRGVYLEHPDYDSEALFELIDATELHLTVRARSPDYFYAILRDSVEALIKERWPGLTYNLFVPCPEMVDGDEGCTGRFKFENLLKFRERAIPQITCQECAEPQDVYQLLTGFAMPVEALGQELVALRDRLADLHADVKQIKAFAADGARHIRIVLKAISEETKDCPRLYTVVPKDRKKFNPKRLWSSSYKLTLWCEQPGHEHPCEGASYSIAQPKKWLEESAPYLSLVSKTLRIALPIAGAMAGAAMEEADFKIISDEINLMEKLVAALPTEVDGSPDSEHAADGLTAAQGAGLRALRSFLLKQDKSRSFGGLRRVLTAAGDYLWVCPKHYSEHDPGLPELPY